MARLPSTGLPPGTDPVLEPQPGLAVSVDHLDALDEGAEEPPRVELVAVPDLVERIGQRSHADQDRVPVDLELDGRGIARRTVLAEHRLDRKLEVVHLLVREVEPCRQRRYDEARGGEEPTFTGQGEGDRVRREVSLTGFVDD